MLVSVGQAERRAAEGKLFADKFRRKKVVI